MMKLWMQTHLILRQFTILMVTFVLLQATCSAQSTHKKKIQPEDVLTSFGIEPTVPNAIQALRSQNSLIQINAAKLLGRMKEPTAIPALLTTLEDESESVRVAAAEALLSLGNKTGLTVLTAALRSQDKDVVVSAASTLCNNNIPESFQTLKSLVTAEPAYIREIALLAIESCNVPSNEKKSLFFQATRDSNKNVRLTALEGLSRVPDQFVVDLLIKTLRDNDEVLRFAADKWLKQITHQSFKFGHTDPLERREEAIRKWELWWRENRERFDFNK